MSENDNNILNNRYKKEGEKFLIEMELDNPKHLFDRKDPSPIKGRDLNEDVVTYIINSLREIPASYPVILKIYFTEGSEERKFSSEKVADAIKTFFLFEEYNKSMELKLKFKRGFKALFIGLSFLFLCIFFSSSLEHTSKNLLWLYFQEGLNVLGWVSMWYPINVFLFEWWPIKEEKEIYHRAFCLQVKVTYYSKNLSLLGAQ